MTFMGGLLAVWAAVMLIMRCVIGMANQPQPQFIFPHWSIAAALEAIAMGFGAVVYIAHR